LGPNFISAVAASHAPPQHASRMVLVQIRD
jgi:hypothetical protein